MERKAGGQKKRKMKDNCYFLSTRIVLGSIKIQSTGTKVGTNTDIQFHSPALTVFNNDSVMHTFPSLQGRDSLKTHFTAGSKGEQYVCTFGRRRMGCHYRGLNADATSCSKGIEALIPITLQREKEL